MCAQGQRAIVTGKVLDHAAGQGDVKGPGAGAGGLEHVTGGVVSVQPEAVESPSRLAEGGVTSIEERNLGALPGEECGQITAPAAELDSPEPLDAAERRLQARQNGRESRSGPLAGEQSIVLLGRWAVPPGLFPYAGRGRVTIRPCDHRGWY